MTDNRLQEQIEEELYAMLDSGGGNASSIRQRAENIASILDKRVSELIQYNSEQVVARRTQSAKAVILHTALAEVEERLTHWLHDNLPEDCVFEDIPEIDQVRTIAQDAMEAAKNVNPADYGRP